jgi:hypothetical protein
MAVISLQKQPGTVERDGSRRASPPILAAASLPTGHSGCRAVACDRDERLRPVPATRRGQPRSRRGGHVRCRWILQLRGEILLQIHCRCSETRSPMQFTIAQPDSCGSSRAAVRFTGSGWTAERSGWARIPNRLDRRGASFETAACAASSGLGTLFMPSKAYPHPEERRKARLEGRKTVRQFLAQPRSGTHGRHYRA